MQIEWPFRRSSLREAELAELRAFTNDYVFLTERLAELELTREDEGWTRLLGEGTTELSRETLRKICHDARIYYLKNPLIQRGVDVQTHYVFGQGVDISAEAEIVNDVIQGFLTDARNRAELTGHQAMEYKERELQLFGNIFFVFFTNDATGRVLVRTLPVDEVEEILCDPEDARSPRYYKRVWQSIPDGAEAVGTTEEKTAYYPDWRYSPESIDRKDVIGEHKVEWESPIYHVKTGGLSDMRFGVSEVYAGIAWAAAYKEFLEDWATLSRAYSQWAHKISFSKKSDLTAAKAKLNTTLGSSSAETNPPPLVGSTALVAGGTDISTMKIGGANVSAEDGRRLLLMVAAATGLPESFFGDVSVGTLATAKSLDRPTELKMVSRQTLWADVFVNILDYVILQAVDATSAPLKGKIDEEPDGTPSVELELPENPDTGEPQDGTVKVLFPPILEHDVNEGVDAIIQAATLGGHKAANTIDAITLSRILLNVLGVPDIDSVLETLYPGGAVPEQPNGENDTDEEGEENDKEQPMTPEEELTTAIRELGEAVDGLGD